MYMYTDVLTCSHTCLKLLPEGVISFSHPGFVIGYAVKYMLKRQSKCHKIASCLGRSATAPQEGAFPRPCCQTLNVVLVPSSHQPQILLVPVTTVTGNSPKSNHLLSNETTKVTNYKLLVTPANRKNEKCICCAIWHCEANTFFVPGNRFTACNAACPVGDHCDNFSIVIYYTYKCKYMYMQFFKAKIATFSFH